MVRGVKDNMKAIGRDDMVYYEYNDRVNEPHISGPILVESLAHQIVQASEGWDSIDVERILGDLIVRGEAYDVENNQYKIVDVGNVLELVLKMVRGEPLGSEV